MVLKLWRSLSLVLIVLVLIVALPVLIGKREESLDQDLEELKAAYKEMLARELVSQKQEGVGSNAGQQGLKAELLIEEIPTPLGSIEDSARIYLINGLDIDYLFDFASEGLSHKEAIQIEAYLQSQLPSDMSDIALKLYYHQIGKLIHD